MSCSFAHLYLIISIVYSFVPLLCLHPHLHGNISCFSLHPSPSPLFPFTMINLDSGVWVMSGSVIIHNGDIIRENYCRSLDSLSVSEDYV